MTNYPIYYQGNRPRPVLAPARTYGVNMESMPVVPAGSPGDATLTGRPLSEAGTGGFNPPPMTRRDLSGSEEGATAETPW